MSYFCGRYFVSAVSVDSPLKIYHHMFIQFCVVDLQILKIAVNQAAPFCRQHERKYTSDYLTSRELCNRINNLDVNCNFRILIELDLPNLR